MPKLSEIIGEAFNSLPEDVRTKYKEIDLVDSTGYVEKKELTAVNNTITQYKKDIKKRDDDLEALKLKSSGDKNLQDEIDRLKLENETSAQDYQKELDKIKFDAKFEKAIGEYKVRNPKALKALMDIEKVKLVDDTFIGLDEQLKALKESDAYLFEDEGTGGTGSIGGGATPLIDDKGEGTSIGALLAKAKVDNSSAEAQNKFFQ